MHDIKRNQPRGQCPHCQRRGLGKPFSLFGAAHRLCSFCGELTKLTSPPQPKGESR